MRLIFVIVFVLFSAISCQAMMPGVASAPEDAPSPADGRHTPDMSTLEKMWMEAKGAAARKDAERLRHVAIMALQNPERVSGKPDGMFSVNVAPVKNGSKVTLNFDFMGIESSKILSFLTSYSYLDLYLGKKHKTLQELYETCKAQKNLSELDPYFMFMHFDDGSFRSEKVVLESSDGQLRPGYSLMQVTLKFSFKAEEERAIETLTYQVTTPLENPRKKAALHLCFSDQVFLPLPKA